jgi:S-phase kinase-associated protein 1
MSAEQQFVNLVSGDGETFQVTMAAAKLSKLVENVLELTTDEEIPEIPLPNVDKVALQKIAQFMTHFSEDNEENKNKVVNIPKPIMSTKMSEIVPEWYAEYVNVHRDIVIATLLGANYMNITELVHLTCATIASWAKCKTPQEIMEVFGITEDFTEEEIAQVKAENKEYEERMKAVRDEEAAMNSVKDTASEVEEDK